MLRARVPRIGRPLRWTRDLRDRRVVILVPDKTRRCGVDRILPALLPFVRPDTRVIFAVGLHRRQSRAEQLAILGTDALPFRDAGPPYVRLGTTHRGTPVEIDRDVAHADAIIGIGRVALHYFAGFSGGRKLIVPGCASPRAIQANHRLVLDGGTALGELRGNPLHEDLMEAARMAPPATLVNVVPGGTVVTGLDNARVCVAPRVHVRPYDFIVAGTGAPYDVNLIQSHKTLAHVCEGVRDGGTIVMAAECPEGAGHPDFAQAGTAREQARALREDYRVYRQTAWALRVKAERWRIVMVTRADVPPGIRRVGSLEEAAFLTRGRGAIVPDGPGTWVTSG